MLEINDNNMMVNGQGYGMVPEEDIWLSKFLFMLAKQAKRGVQWIRVTGWVEWNDLIAWHGMAWNGLAAGSWRGLHSQQNMGCLGYNVLSLMWVNAVTTERCIL